MRGKRPFLPGARTSGVGPDRSDSERTFLSVRRQQRRTLQKVEGGGYSLCGGIGGVSYRCEKSGRAVLSSDEAGARRAGSASIHRPASGAHR